MVAAPAPLLWIVPALFVIEIVNVNRPGLMWVHWPTTIDVVNGAYVLLAPLCAGVSCAIAVPLIRRWELVSALPDNGLRVLLLPAAATTVAFSTVHVAVLGGVVAVGVGKGMVGVPNPLPAIAVIAAFAAASCLGALVAKMAPSMIAAPFCVLLVYAYEIFEPRTANRLFSDFGGATVLLLGLKHRPDILVWQTAWLITVACLLLAVAIWGRRIGPSLFTGLLLVALPVATAVMLNTSTKTRFSETSVQWVCTGDTPEVCVIAEYTNVLEPYATRVTKYANKLSDLGASVPQTFRQAIGADRPAGGFFSITRDPGDEPIAFQILQSALPCSTRWGNSEFRNADLVIAFLVKGRGGRLVPYGRPATLPAARKALQRLAC